MSWLRYKIPLLVVLLGMLASCSMHPLGMSGQEWEALTPEQQLRAREQQAVLDQAAAERRAAQARADEAEALRQAAELQLRRQLAAPGERIQCVLGPHEAWLNRKWRAAEPLALDLLQGDEQRFDLVQAGSGSRSYYANGYARFDGETLLLCPHAAADWRRDQGCTRLLGTSGEWQRGLRGQLESDSFLRGSIRCEAVGANDRRRRGQ